MNKEEQLQALVGDKLLDFILYEEMTKRMPDLSVSNLISIRHRLASNAYLAIVWDILYRDDFIDNYSVHDKGTMIEMQLTKAYKEGNQEFITKCIKDLLWHDVYVQFTEKRKIILQNAETNTTNLLSSKETKSTHVQATPKTKTKENQTYELTNTSNQQVQTNFKPDMENKQIQTITSIIDSGSSLLDLFEPPLNEREFDYD